MSALAKIVVLIQFILGPMILTGQSYRFEMDTQPYVELQGSTSLNNGLTWDEPGFVVPIGFEFLLFDETIRGLDFGFDNAGLLWKDRFALPSSILFIHVGFLIDRGIDLNAGAGQPGSLSNISFKTEGNPGSRIFKLEWKNVGFSKDIEDDGVSTDFVNFQLWLYESSNTIEIHHGPSTVIQTNFAYERGGPYIALMNNFFDSYEEVIYLEGNPINPTFVSTTEVINLPSLNRPVPPNVVYRFTRNSTSSNVYLNDSEKFTIYPNPVNNVLFVKSESDQKEVLHCKIVDISGREIMKPIYDDGEVDVSNLPAGVYTLELQTALSIHKQLFTKQ